MSIEKLFFNSLMSVASYVDFQDGEDHTEGSTKLKLESNGDWSSEKMRALFLEKFEILSHRKNSYRGFSATVFRVKQSNEVVFANRGTTPTDIGDIHADIDIFLNGISRLQVIDLFNYVSYLKTPLGQSFPVAQITENGVIFNNTGIGAGKGSWFSTPVDITGHSLGGNLSGALGRIFPSLVQDLYVYNSAGTAGILAQDFSLSFPYIKWNPTEFEFFNYFDQFGAVDSYENFQNVFNLFGEDGGEVVTNDVVFNQIGGAKSRIGINTEGATHSSIALSESLSVAWIFNKLDPTFSLADHSALVDAAQASESGSLSKLTNALLLIIQGSKISDLWDGVYNISQLDQTANIKVLATLSHQELLEYYQNSGSKKALIYSAHNGLPFAVEGAYSAYDSIDENQYSSEAIYDLMAKLATELNIYSRDSSPGNELGVGNAKFSLPNDVAIENEESANPLAKRDVVFGSEASDVVSGTAQDNRLYGLGGSDTLNGSDDRDILDGGNDEDKLFGNGGNDLLIGGKGDDELDGGEGNDTLDGGEGNDTYLFTSESGHDVIEKYNSVSLGDSDGVIKYHDKVIDGSGAKKKSEQANIFYDKDEKVTYSKFDNNLLIEFEEDNKIVSSVTIRGFKNGNLGINLPENKEEPEDNTLDKYVATEVFQSYYDDCISEGQNVCLTLDEKIDRMSEYSPEYQAIGNVDFSYTRIAIGGNDGFTFINDTAYKSDVLGGAGDDRLIGGENDDYFRGTGSMANQQVDVDGNDYLAGNGGNDKLFGYEGKDILEGGDGDDFLYGGYSWVAENNPDHETTSIHYASFEEYNADERFKEDNDVLIGGAGRDLIEGHRGSDYLDGGDGDDDLFAGAHNDRIDGGAGDDFILADGTKASKLVLEPSTTLGFKFETLFENAKKHAGDDTVYAGDGNDIVLGGAGNDIIYGGNDDDKLYGDGTYDNDEERIIQESSIDLHGEDIIDGGAGNDLIFGYGNKDVLSGGAGDDKIYGDHDSLDESLHDADIIHGGEGNDEIMGFGGDDRLFGDDGDDVIDAGKGNDYLDGGAGNDELQGQDDDDQLYGKADNDKLFGQKGNDYLDGGSGDDELVGGEGTDVLIGGSGADKLWGNEGDDSLAGGSGDDLLYGGSGNDTLSGGSGYDALRGEEGNDTYIANIGDGFSGISDASGANSIQFGAGVSMGNISVEVIGNGVVLNYGAGDKIFIEDASVGSIHNINFVNGTSISLSSLLRDLIPDNTASGWGGGNTSATINASSNEITYVREDNSLVVRYTGSSEDWIDSEALTNAGYMFTIETVTVNGQPVQQVRFFNWYNANHSRYLNRLHLTDQTVSLSEVTEVSATFSGSDFVDNVNASSASDQISTAGGNDVINAGGGDDVITAGAGNDQVQGGAGNDSYYFNLGDGFDTIFDESGTDRIVFGDGISLNMLQFFETTQGLKVIINNSDYSVNSGFIVIGWFNETNYQIERFEFADGSVLLSAEVDGLVQGNRSPLLNESLTDQSINLGQPFNLTLSPTLFVDPNGDQLSIDVRLSDGSALPAWLTFNAETQTLAGTPGINDIDDLEIVVIARDPSQYFASTQFNINVDEDAGYIGTDADERIEGTDKDDYIRGMGGNDYILGNSGNDRIDGGKGDDRLTGGYGNDTFEFSLSDGIDVIETPYADYAQFTGTDVIKFGKNITQDDVYLYRSPDAYQDLLIMYGNSGDEILVKEYFSRTSQYPIDQIQFNDGSVWTSDDVLEKLQHFIDNSDNFIRHVLPSDFVVDALGGNDFIDGNSGNDILMGNDGDDWLYGKQGDDRLNGGIGNDGLLGEKGNNTYEFSYGHGIDVIWHDNYDSNDIIKIDQTINFNQLEYRRFGDHLVVGTGEENYIIIDEFFGNFIYSDDLNDRIKLEDENGNSILLADVPVSGAYLDKLHWPTIDTRALDGSGLNYGEITDSTNNSFKHRIIGTNDHDIIYGSSDADTISSNDGNDFIEAGAGNDAITIGTGSSIIYPGLGTDVITIAGNSEVKVSDGDGVNYIRKSWRNIDSFKLTADSSFELSDTAFTISDDYNNLSINLSDNTQIILEKFIESDASEFNLN